MSTTVNHNSRSRRIRRLKRTARKLHWALSTDTGSATQTEVDPSCGRIHQLRITEVNAALPLILDRSVHEAIRRTIGRRPAESGGALGGSRRSGAVTDFDFDHSAHTTTVTYYPDTARLNGLFRAQWNPAGINLVGFCHSHPAGAPTPSEGDRRYATDILRAIPELPRLALPIVQTARDTGYFSMRAFVATRHAEGTEIAEVPLEIRDLQSEPETTVTPGMERAHTAYDALVMATSRFVAIGCGGSASFLDELARTGIREIVLIDPDEIESPNLGTQQVYAADVGRSKVAALAARLVGINPRLDVHILRASLDDLTDDGMRRLCWSSLAGGSDAGPKSVVLGAFTDDFWAQARVARLGLHLGVPVVGGSVYAQGRGVELTWAAGGLTSACIRCALARRYAAYLERGYRNDVTAHGTPISATMRLNALKMPVVLGLLHATSSVSSAGAEGTDAHRRFIEQIKERNLVVVGADLEAIASLGLSAFAEIAALDSRGRIGADLTLWLQQRPDNPANGFPACPDCGGTGDLADSENRFADTRPMPLVHGDFRQ